MISSIRAARSELNVPPGAQIQIYQPDKLVEAESKLIENSAALERMAKAFPTRLTASIEVDAISGSAQIAVNGVPYVMPLKGHIDIDNEKARLTKALEASTKEAKSLEGRLSNPAFVEKAKPEAVDKARADHAMHAAEAERLAAALARLG